MGACLWVSVSVSASGYPCLCFFLSPCLSLSLSLASSLSNSLSVSPCRDGETVKHMDRDTDRDSKLSQVSCSIRIELKSIRI